jgi:biopolymer transport protein ExbD
VSLRRHLGRRHLEGAELELTAFINPMVVLVTFLLINVVFSHTAVLDLSLPPPANGSSSAPAEKLLLEVTVRQDAIEVGDRNRGLLNQIPNVNGAPDLAQLSAQLEQLKNSYPQQRDATVLLEPDVSYDRLVQVMDAMRSVNRLVDGQSLNIELFPDIALGDAPADK